MSSKTITHEVKLQKSVIVILGVMAFGLCANVFAPALSVKEALSLDDYDTITVNIGGHLSHSGRIKN